jgi:CBS domain-containing protein
MTETSRRLAALRRRAFFRIHDHKPLGAYAFLQTLRVRAQALTLRQGQPPDNMILPSRLSSLERDRLRDCLKIVPNSRPFAQQYGLRFSPLRPGSTRR